jgi:hypothetical protein
MKTMMKLFTMMMVLMLLGIVLVHAQTNPVPIPTGSLYKQGTNVADPIGPVATENPDLVTTGTKVPYLVIPDPVLNPTWAPGADATNTTGITSIFNWTIPAGISATVPGTGHYITIDVNGAATNNGVINVKEQSGASCPDATGTNINVRVVAQPSATALAVSDGVAPLTSICQGGTNGSLNVPFPTFTVTKATDAAIPGDATIRVKGTLVFTPLSGAPLTIFTDGILNVNAASGDISNADITTASGGSLTDYDSWGIYTLTITQISDKISRKDMNAAAGYFNINGGAGYTATYTVFKTPTTGPIYHLPNN